MCIEAEDNLWYHSLRAMHLVFKHSVSPWSVLSKEANLAGRVPEGQLSQPPRHGILNRSRILVVLDRISLRSPG